MDQRGREIIPQIRINPEENLDILGNKFSIKLVLLQFLIKSLAVNAQDAGCF